MGAPRGGTGIEEERKQCGPAVTRFGPHTGETNHRAHAQAWATSPRRRNRSNPSRLEDRQTRRERQPQGSRREETRGQGSMPFKHDITGTGERGSTRATAGRTTNNNPQPGRQTPFIASNKRPGPRRRTTWCGTHQVADATAHASSTSARPRAGWPVMACRLISDQWRCRRLGWDESQAPRSDIHERTHTQSQRHPPAEAKRPFGVRAKDCVVNSFVFPAGFLLLH